MGRLPDRPDLAQLRRQAKELRKEATGGDADALRRVGAVSDRTTLAAAQLAVAREHGFESWPRLRAAVEGRRKSVVTALMPDKHRRGAVHGAAEFLAWAETRGWNPGPLPVGAVFTSQTFITSHLEQHGHRYRASDSLHPTNGRVFLTTTDPPVAIACLGVGAPPVVTLLEHLVGLGVRFFIAVGPAPAVSPDVERGDCIIIDRALRDDGISHHYVEPARYAAGDRSLTERLHGEADVRGLEPRLGSSWTVPTPYRTTAEELSAYRDEGVLVTELFTAALFAVAAALRVRAASAVIATRTLGSGTGAPPEEQRAGRMFTLIDVAINTLRGQVEESR